MKRAAGSANTGHVEYDHFCALQRAHEGLRQLEVGADAVEQEERRPTLRTVFDRDAQSLRPNFDRPNLEFSRSVSSSSMTARLEPANGFAHQSKTYVPGAAAPGG